MLMLQCMNMNRRLQRECDNDAMCMLTSSNVMSGFQRVITSDGHSLSVNVYEGNILNHTITIIGADAFGEKSSARAIDLS